jgi:hypothetical protein
MLQVAAMKMCKVTVASKKNLCKWIGERFSRSFVENATKLQSWILLRNVNMAPISQVSECQTEHVFRPATIAFCD